MEANIIIIGAGISALAAAQKLATKHGNKILIIEARDRIGGRIQSMHDPFPCHVDLGATLVLTFSRSIKIVAELHPPSELHGYDDGNPLKNIADYLGLVGLVLDPGQLSH